MPWIIGVDEAGYGPNLGPFVMASVACRVPDDVPGFDLWEILRSVVRKDSDPDDGRLVVDDSKKVYNSANGLGALELGVLAALWRNRHSGDAKLHNVLEHVCAESLEELGRENWYRGAGPVPAHTETDDLAQAAVRFEQACAETGLLRWELRSDVVPAPRFNVLAEESNSKGSVLGHALGRLLQQNHDLLEGDESLNFFVDKHGGRNSYAAMIQHALPDGIVQTESEGRLRSTYRVHNLRRIVRLTFQPRADAEHFCVALASMAAKYLRERLMAEFNRFWTTHVPDLKPTAGYPNDAVRFMNAIRPAAVKLGIAEDAIWRKR